MAIVALFDGMNMDAFQESDLADSTIDQKDSGALVLRWGGRYFMEVDGVGLTYANFALLTGGVATGLEVLGPYGHVVIEGAHANAALLGQAYTANDPQISNAALLAGDDTIAVLDNLKTGSTPSSGHDYLARGYAGDDLMIGGGMRSTLYGGEGADTIQAVGGDGNYLRGDDGNDSISGAAGFDNVNGNKGDDTIDGGAGGSDWLTGGQGNDLISAHASHNILNGNLGNDTMVGGAGGDVLRGGQGDDLLVGGSSADWISGDRGSDTLQGGGGADTFHAFAGGGLDVVADFNAAEGDRVQLDPGTSFSVRQLGDEVVIDLGGGDQLLLPVTRLSDLPPGWLLT